MIPRRHHADRAEDAGQSTAASEPGTPGGLARLARRALATTTGGVLHVDGICVTDRSGSPGVLLYEEAGRPRFLCEPHDSLTGAAHAGRQAVLEIDGGHCRHGRNRVVIAGPLAVIGTERTDGGTVHVVELAVRTVHVGTETPSPRAVPVGDYLAVDLDPFAETAARIVAHLNAKHPDRLRACVAARVGQSVTAIIAAQVGEPDEYGLALTWLDGTGSHRVRLRFGRRLTSPADLIGELHGLLDDHDDATGSAG